MDRLYPDLTDPKASKLCVVHYENLKRDLEPDLRRIVDFLDLEVDEERLACAISRSEGSFHRKQRENSSKKGSTHFEINGGKHPFTPEQMVLVRDAITRVHQALVSRGWDGLPVELYDIS